jgi:cell division protein ZapA
MSADRQTVKVTIFHQTYTLTVDGDPGEVETLAQSVDNLMTEIAQKAGNVDANRIAVLASLHLADRLRSIELELSELKARVDSKSRQFSLMLDRANV